MMIRQLIMTIAAFVVLLASCTSNSTEDTKTGSISIGLSADSQFDIVTKAGVEVPSVNDFVIEVSTQEGEVVFSSGYKDMPLLVYLERGGYVISATEGPQTDYSESTPTYKAIEEVEVGVAQTTVVDMVATIYTPLLEVRYSGAIAEGFSDYYVDIAAVSSTYRVGHNQNQGVYLYPQELVVLFRGTTVGGVEFSQIIDRLYAESATHYIYNIDLVGGALSARRVVCGGQKL